jgi:hypothetical protein
MLIVTIVGILVIVGISFRLSPEPQERPDVVDGVAVAAFKQA